MPSDTNLSSHASTSNCPPKAERVLHASFARPGRGNGHKAGRAPPSLVKSSGTTLEDKLSPVARNQDEDPRTINWINDKAFPGNGGAEISAGPRMIDPLTAEGGFSSKNEKQDRTCKLIQMARISGSLHTRT